LESLREPLEPAFAPATAWQREKMVSISRTKGTEVFPANFILVAAMNPCPCGFKGTRSTGSGQAKKECVCSAGDIYKYERKLSGPIRDRIDIFLPVAEIDYKKLSDKVPEGTDTSKNIRDRVLKAREIQEKRFEGKRINTNSEMSAKDLEKFAPLGEKEKNLLNSAATRMSLSPRAYHRIIKLARTIADLAGSENIQDKHLAEALGYREKKG